MSINLTDELQAKTKKGKIASAKQVFLEGDQENLQQIGDKTHQLEDAIKDITVSGGASTANAVSYNNETSGMTAVTAQGAIDELASKKANSADVTSQMQTEQSRVNSELSKKFDKDSISQESGNAVDKVMSQKAVSDKLSELSNTQNNIKNKTDYINVKEHTNKETIDVLREDGSEIFHIEDDGIIYEGENVCKKAVGAMQAEDFPIENRKGNIYNDIIIADDDDNEVVHIRKSGVTLNNIFIVSNGIKYSIVKLQSKKNLETFHTDFNYVHDASAKNVGLPLVYKADTHASDVRTESNFIINAICYPSGEIIAERCDGKVTKIDNRGKESILFTINNSTEWRLLWMDSNLNVYISPDGNDMDYRDRGLYKLSYGDSTFRKVIALYDPSSSIEQETYQVNSKIWTMCEDDNGYLYAGVYQNQEPWNPAIYRSKDGGNTWNYLFNFRTSGLVPDGHHIHFVDYNPYNRKLYVTVGEHNQVFESSDHGETWSSLDVVLEDEKGTSILPVNNGLIIGSDSAYSCCMHKVYPDGTFRVCGRLWANVVFGIRKSDITGWLYAFTMLDASVDSLEYMPPIDAINDSSVLSSWIESKPSHIEEWKKYNNMCRDYFPEDSVRPQHCSILISKDSGETWEILYKEKAGLHSGSGFPVIGQFRNGECLCAFKKNENGNGIYSNPIVISEGKHIYGELGVSVEGDIFAKLLSNKIIKL